MSDRAMTGTPIRGGVRASKAYKPGRVCQDHECETILSVYNRGRFCSRHEPMAVPRTRGRKIA